MSSMSPTVLVTFLMCESVHWVEWKEDEWAGKKVEQMGSSGETVSRAVLPSLQCWQVWSAAVSGTWRQAGSWACTPLATADGPLRFERFRCGGTSVEPSTPSVWLQQAKQCLAAVSSLLPSGIQIQEDLSYWLGLHYSAVAELVCRDYSLPVRIPLQQTITEQLQLTVKKTRRDTGDTK